MKSYIIASALLVASITGAQAADVVVQEPVAAYNWSGVYVGANIGWSGLKSDWHDIDDDWTGGSFKAGSDGILLGGVPMLFSASKATWPTPRTSAASMLRIHS